jgi:hypothetical protein
LLSLTCLGCGAAQRPTRANVVHLQLDSAGRALVEADKLYACHDRAAHAGGACNGKPVTLPDWNAQLALWHELRDAIAHGYKTVLGAEVAIETWEAGDKRRWLAAEPCVASALVRVRAALQALDALPPFELPVPSALSAITLSPCNCLACEDDFYPYAAAPAQEGSCESALACK